MKEKKKIIPKQNKTRYLKTWASYVLWDILFSPFHLCVTMSIIILFLTGVERSFKFYALNIT